jgi:hypothetical protein
MVGLLKKNMLILQTKDLANGDPANKGLSLSPTQAKSGLNGAPAIGNRQWATGKKAKGAACGCAQKRPLNFRISNQAIITCKYKYILFISL